MELLVSGQFAANKNDALFADNFALHGPSYDMTGRCLLCGYEASGTLADVRVDALTHLEEAHDFTLVSAAELPER